ncbi:hypothetical protein SeMB42_g00969 [Synchytrium endobioticum]|uniref:Nodulin-like domain-containing protein n=1 Tax=Synchytrium endobioticum TaxID=286115 RepID=A0A507DN57_9FUNG|nr:hypothetical protein SeMB42_g00969 [Synchytrium endobioticum]
MERIASWKLGLSLFAAILSQIAAGSANLFSLYAPQLSQRLGYSQTQTTSVGIAMNLGMYLSGILVGHWIDKYRKNPTPLFILAAVLLSTGYFLMSVVYNSTLEVNFNGEAVSTHFIAYAAYAAIVGIGSCLCNQTSIAANLRNFPPSWRGLAVGLPMSFFGLSAMILSQIAKYAFYVDAGELAPATLDVASFLMFIGCLSGIICLFAALVLQDYSGYVKDVDTPTLAHQQPPSSHWLPHHHHNTPPSASCDPAWTEQTPLRAHQPTMTRPVTPSIASSSSSAHPMITTQQPIHPIGNRHSKPENSLFAIEGYTLPRPKTPISPDSVPPSYQHIASGSYGTIDVRPAPITIVEDVDLDSEDHYIEDVSCFRECDAYLLAFIMFSLAGVGLMHINNVGAVILSLAPSPATPSSPVVQSAQSLHVSLISVCGFTAQVIVGSFADTAYRSFKLHRMLWMVIAAVLLTTGSLFAATMLNDLPSLVWVTALIGAGNGAAWSAAPMLVGDFFGQKRFATHFGWMSLAPAFGGQAFSLIFGVVFDAAKSNPPMPDLRGDFEECHGSGGLADLTGERQARQRSAGTQAVSVSSIPTASVALVSDMQQPPLRDQPSPPPEPSTQSPISPTLASQSPDITTQATAPFSATTGGPSSAVPSPVQPSQKPSKPRVSVNGNPQQASAATAPTPGPVASATATAEKSTAAPVMITVTTPLKDGAMRKSKLGGTRDANR